MTDVQNKLCFSVWCLGQRVQSRGKEESPAPRPFLRALYSRVWSLPGLGFARTAGRLGLGNAGSAGLGEGSSGCFSTCLCWHRCLLGPWPVSLCQHKPCSAQELRCCRCHRPDCGHRAGIELQAGSKCPLLSWVVFSTSELNPSICCRKAATQWELHPAFMARSSGRNCCKAIRVPVLLPGRNAAGLASGGQRRGWRCFAEGDAVAETGSSGA